MPISIWIVERAQRSNGMAMCDGVHLSTYNLPPLEGPTRQVEKAKAIRNTALFAIRREIEVRTRTQLTNGTHGPEETFTLLNRSLAELGEMILRHLESARSAAWWIEHEKFVTNPARGSDILNLLKLRAEGH